jgi:LmbE family N-acetylglucosaminyl deacetylase
MLVWVIAQTLLLVSSWTLAGRLLPASTRCSERASAACLIALATPIAIVGVLSAASAIVPAAVLITTALTCVAALWLGGTQGRSLARSDLKTCGTACSALVKSSACLPALPGLAALGLATWAAAILPIWAWDALGYHFPIVWDALEHRELRFIPTHGYYINTYPRAGEMYYLWARVLLGRDEFLELGQAPFALVTGVCCAAFARRAGASPPRAAGYALAFLAVPIVAMQIPTGYVDLMYACLLSLAMLFATAELGLAGALLFGLAAGLLLACKPTAPPTVAILLALYAARSLSAKRWRLTALSVAVVAGIGSWTYVRNLLRFGNPLFPVEFSVGPLYFPGPNAMGPMLVQGLPDAVNRGWVYRVAISLFANPDYYAYDMRYGGFWPLVPCLVPLALLSLARKENRSTRLGPALLSALALASPMAQWLRFGLAFPVGLLALAAAQVDSYRPWLRRSLDLALAAAAAIGVHRAWPGFNPGGPTLLQIAHGAGFGGMDGHEVEFTKLKARLQSGEAAAYDPSFATPGRLYRDDGAVRVLYLDPKQVAPTQLLDWTLRNRVSVLAVADRGPLRAALLDDPEHFTPVMSCPVDPCHIYQVRRGREPRPAELTRPTDVMVVAPHPDDEVLIAAGVLARAIRAHREPRIVIMTNGDFDCVDDGLRRQAESIAALGVLGVPEDNVEFLGYPDGYLARLGSAILPKVKRRVQGRCERHDLTYGEHGRARRDFHRMRFGKPGAYSAESIVADLAAILAEFRPRDVYITHPLDQHPDHAATYALLRRAIDRQPWAPRLHRALVHIGGCWPNQSLVETPCRDIVLRPDQPVPDLPGELSAYRAPEQLPVPEDMRDPVMSRNLKARALLKYQSQLRGWGLESYLASFIRSTEAFFPEELVLDERARWVRNHASRSGRTVPRGEWQKQGKEHVMEIEQQVPISLRVMVPAVWDQVRVEFLKSGRRGYSLRFSASGPGISLWRDRGAGAQHVHTWPLPHDAHGPAVFDLWVEARPEDGDVAEFTLLRNDDVVGVGLDVHPISWGFEVRVSGIPVDYFSVSRR